MSRTVKGGIFAALYLLSIVAAALAVEHIGTVPVGFGLMAPAGAYVVGMSMVLRDLAQDQLGPRWTFGAMLIGTGLSAAVSPTLAVAAAAAFLISESLDLMVYTPLRKKSLVGAVLASNVVGAVVDSLVFLSIAFGSLEFFYGQLWAKVASTLLALLVLLVIYRGRGTHTPAYLLAGTPRRRRTKTKSPLMAGKD